MKVVPIESGNHDWYFNGGFSYKCLKCSTKATRVTKGIIRVEENFGSCLETFPRKVRVNRVANHLYSLVEKGKEYRLADPPKGRPNDEVWVSVSSTRKVRLLPSEYQ